jgi:hypothetical protein
MLSSMNTQMFRFNKYLYKTYKKQISIIMSFRLDMNDSNSQFSLFYCTLHKYLFHL